MGTQQQSRLRLDDGRLRPLDRMHDRIDCRGAVVKDGLEDDHIQILLSARTCGEAGAVVSTCMRRLHAGLEDDHIQIFLSATEILH